MERSLSEDIRRGRLAIRLARERGMDTTEWEKVLADLERQELLGWAWELAEKDLVLSREVRYVEAPRRTVTTRRVSHYAALYLKTIAKARLYQDYLQLCWPSQWWQEREQEALASLQSLRKALEEKDYG